MLKSDDSGLSRSWAVCKRHESFYTGGKVQLAHRGHFLVCSRSTDVAFVQIDTGAIIGLLRGKDPVRAARRARALNSALGSCCSIPFHRRSSRARSS